MANFGGWLQDRFADLVEHPDGNRDIITKMCFLIWQIWTGRNHYLFTGLQPDPFFCCQFCRKTS